jgi:hypothetical protein
MWDGYPILDAAVFRRAQLEGQLATFVWSAIPGMTIVETAPLFIVKPVTRTKANVGNI